MSNMLEGRKKIENEGIDSLAVSSLSGHDTAKPESLVLEAQAAFLAEWNEFTAELKFFMTEICSATESRMSSNPNKTK